MSLRLRIFITFALLALLPALPATWAVRQLIYKSFELGLSEDLRAGLDAGAETSRRYLRTNCAQFLSDMWEISGEEDPHEALLAQKNSTDHWLRLNAEGELLDASDELLDADWEDLIERALQWKKTEPVVGRHVGPMILRRGGAKGSHGALIALRNPEKDYLIVSRPIDADFLADFNRVIRAQQLQAGLGLEKERLSRGFLFPFLLVYLVLLLVSLVLAGLLSRRLTRGLDALVDGAERIGTGDWGQRLDPDGRDEVGRLVVAFNDMAAGLQAQQRRLLDLEKMAAWREMARGLAHEIKNPLTPISLVTQELRDRYPGGDESYTALLDESGRIIEEEVESLRRLSREFSKFARTPEMKKLPSDLNQLVRDLAHLYGSVPVELVLDESLPDFDFDPEQMRRVLSNLFENALAAMKGVSEPGIHVRTDSDDMGRAELVFTDRGPGVPEEIRERIFEPHFTTKGSGMGLGLALARSVLLLHGGEIRLEEGPGARFRLCLPMEESR